MEYPNLPKPNRVPRDRGMNWSHGETKMLMQLRLSEDIAAQMRSTSNTKIHFVYQQISELMKVQGFFRNEKQIATKLKHVRRNYYRCRAYNDKCEAAGDSLKKKPILFEKMCAKLWTWPPCPPPNSNLLGYYNQVRLNGSQDSVSVAEPNSPSSNSSSTSRSGSPSSCIKMELISFPSPTPPPPLPPPPPDTNSFMQLSPLPRNISNSTKNMDYAFDDYNADSRALTVDPTADQTLYSSPLVEAPTLRELEDISDVLGLRLKGSLALPEYQSFIADGLKELDKLQECVEPSLPVSYPRTPGYRPKKSENPYNAWYFRTDISGAPSGKLWGKRVAIKDSIAVAGVPMMIGCRALEGYVPDFDATVVRRVLDEGGVIKGKATCEDLCLSGNSHTSSPLPVLNPINIKHSAGGSSSGCAVLVACNEVDIGIGGDQGGSVRIPASFCGLVGLKPTYGLVPYTGAFSGEVTQDHLGPITRNVEECALALEVISGYDEGKDNRQPANIVVPNYSDHLKGLDSVNIRIAILTEGFNQECSDPEVDQLINDIITLFTVNCKNPAVDVSIPLHKCVRAIGNPITVMGAVDCMYTTGGTGFHHQGYYPTSMMRDISDRIRANIGHLSPSSKALLLQGTYLKKHYSSLYGKAQNLRQHLTDAYDHVLGEFDVIAMPTIPFTAPRLPSKSTSVKDLLQMDYNMTSNVKAGNLTGHPSISINAGSIRGMPVGLLLTGKKFKELELLKVAHAFENFINAEHR